GKTYETDEEGYLVNLSDWNDELANEMAKADGAVLGDKALHQFGREQAAIAALIARGVDRGVDRIRAIGERGLNRKGFLGCKQALVDPLGLFGRHAPARARDLFLAAQQDEFAGLAVVKLDREMLLQALHRAARLLGQFERFERVALVPSGGALGEETRDPARKIPIKFQANAKGLVEPQSKARDLGKQPGARQRVGVAVAELAPVPEAGSHAHIGRGVEHAHPPALARKRVGAGHPDDPAADNDRGLVPAHESHGAPTSDAEKPHFGITPITRIYGRQAMGALHRASRLAFSCHSR
ncbi:MAG: TusE/DsrC/DsvC family sulfur relay protein, partial [Erythrobacter sp.]|nr:TusE/DsrC/DsvC family sulfur relay protein [Erythrobacter sp.]